MIELRLGKRRDRLPQDLVGLPEFAHLLLQRLDPLVLVRRRPGPKAFVALGLSDPVAKRFFRATDLGRNRAERAVLRVALILVFQHHPHRMLADLRGKRWGSLRHGSVLARVGASGKLGAVQCDIEDHLVQTRLLADLFARLLRCAKAILLSIIKSSVTTFALSNGTDEAPFAQEGQSTSGRVR